MDPVTSWLPATFGTDVVSGIVSQITAALPILVPVLAFGIGFTIVVRVINHAKNGRV